MSFFDRYAEVCKVNNYEPSSRKLTDILGFNNAAVTPWKKKGKIPMGDTVRAIADFFHVSADYLLERTDDPTDYAKKPPDLSNEERDLLSMFRTLNPEQRKMILTMVEPLYEQAKKETTETA